MLNTLNFQSRHHVCLAGYAVYCSIQRLRLSGQVKPVERHMGLNQIYFLLENKLVC